MTTTLEYKVDDKYWTDYILATTIQECEACDLSKLEVNLFDGNDFGKVIGWSLRKYPKIAFVGQNPSTARVVTSVPKNRIHRGKLLAFVDGKSGDSLFSILQEVGVSDFYVTNACKCSCIGNKAPSKSCMNICVNRFLIEELSNIPIIICLGNEAYNVFKDVRPCYKLPHPSAFRYNSRLRTEFQAELVEILAQEHSLLTSGSHKSNDIDLYNKEQQL